MHIFELIHIRRKVPVAVFETIKRGKLGLRKHHRLLFYGKISILGILLLGLSGYWLIASHYGQLVKTELERVLEASGITLDAATYKIIEWTSKKGHLLIYLIKKA